MKKQEAITKVNECISSVFTKDDVIRLIEQIEEGNNVALTETQIDEISANIKRELINMNTEDIVDFDSVEFDIEYGNRIQLHNIDVNYSNIEEAVEGELRSYAEALKEKNKEVVSC